MSSEPLRFIVDVGVGKKVEGWLRAAGYDVASVRDVNPRASDDDILKKAVEEARIVLTMDKDFGELVYRLGKAHVGVLILRLEDADGNHKVNVMRNIITVHGDKLPGSFCVYQGDTLRVSTPKRMGSNL